MSRQVPPYICCRSFKRTVWILMRLRGCAGSSGSMLVAIALRAEVQKVFDRYTVNFVRRLNRDKAIQMFQEEFKLDEARANLIFDIFDQDRNGLLSIWEFSHFYSSFGYNANEYLDKYNELQSESGTADIAKLFDYLSQFTTKDGQPIEGEKVEKAIMTIAGEKERSIDQRKFIELMCRIKAVTK